MSPPAVDGAIPDASGTDAPSTDSTPDAPPDTADAAPPLRCDPKKDFGAPTVVDGMPLGNNLTARFTDDELTVYYSYMPIGDVVTRVFRAKRASVSAALTEQTMLTFPTEAGAGNMAHPALVPNQLTMYVTGGTSPRDLYIATRGDVAGSAFSSLTLLSTLSSADDDRDPYILRSGKTIYFDRSIPPEGHLYRATGSGATFGAPVQITELDLAGTFAAAPVVSDDELTMFFVRSPTSAGYDVLVSTRASVADPWGTPSAVPNINDPASADVPTWLSPDGCALYFRSQRIADGAERLYVVRRPL